MSSPLIAISGLTKRFKEVKAVDDLSVEVAGGEVFGFLGQNGAGKSTTLRMLLTLIAPSSGSIHIFGKNLQQHRHAILQQVGAIIERPDLYNYLTAAENLKLIARLSGVRPTLKEVMQQLARVGISERAGSKVKTFSQGMKQRLGIACALLHQPQLIILDEPTNGLDPQGIADVRNLILHLSKNEGKTVLVSSHLLSEMEVVADSMLIIDKGKKVAAGKVTHLLNPAATLVQVNTTDNGEAVQKLQTSRWAKSIVSVKEKIGFRLHKDEVPALTADLIALNIKVMEIQPRHSLEDYFLSLTTANQHVAAYQA